uniref:Putative secreted protein n=1 Tax=Anopheles triannulatus TaxID=58253 RepID=A0A2M4B7S2_9DIPT
MFLFGVRPQAAALPVPLLELADARFHCPVCLQDDSPRISFRAHSSGMRIDHPATMSNRHSSHRLRGTGSEQSTKMETF